MKPIPRKARILLFYGVLLIATPSILSLYKGNTGKLIISTGMVSDEIFGHTVIYLNRHDLWASHGIIINKPVALGKVFDNPPPELSWNVKLYDGGPVGKGRNNFLLIPEKTARNGIWIVDIPTLRIHQPDFAAKLDRHENKKNYRLYTGYAGWGPLQLNIEIMRGAWAVIDYDPELMLNTPADQVWDKAMKKALEKSPAASGGA